MSLWYLPPNPPPAPLWTPLTLWTLARQCPHGSSAHAHRCSRRQEVGRKLLGAQSLRRAKNKRVFGRNERCGQRRRESGIGFESVKRCEDARGSWVARFGGAWVMVSGGWSALISGPDSDSLQTAGRAAAASLHLIMSVCEKWSESGSSSFHWTEN